jgi:predicted aldo/keto reductase-like oxidoreductase
MIYKKFKALELSWLGLGIMRMPVVGKNGPIDTEKAMALVEHAYKNGINFFDTAFFYHSGESQPFLAKALSRFPRETWYISNKFPGNLISVEGGKLVTEQFANLPPASFSSVAEIFEGQLRDSGVDYFDFYMLHNVCEETYNLYTDEKLGIVDYLLEQKKAGRIRYLGISTHGRPDTIEKFLNWRDFAEFALVQVNYLDWHLQDAAAKYEAFTSRGIPVFAMEPVRGGKLADPGEKAVEILKAARPDDTAAMWAFRFLQSLGNMPLILSGMTTMEQLAENLEIFGKESPLSEEEKGVISKAVETIAEMVPCTACRYCVDICPAKLDIPALLTMYNEKSFDTNTWPVDGQIRALNDDEKPGACMACGVCNPLCPQNIDIPDAMGKFDGLIRA